jgi:hypothetical protein
VKRHFLSIARTTTTIRFGWKKKKEKRVSNLIMCDERFATQRRGSYLPGIDTVCAVSKGGNKLSDPELDRRRRRPAGWPGT